MVGLSVLIWRIWLVDVGHVFHLKSNPPVEDQKSRVKYGIDFLVDFDRVIWGGGVGVEFERVSLLFALHVLSQLHK
jgi:hypothetical protein